MKQKEIYEFLLGIVELLQKKAQSEATSSPTESSTDYTSGQLYEASYILENIQRIIFKD